MKYLIIGNKGQLGSQFQEMLESSGSAVFGFDLDSLDVTHFDEVKKYIKDNQPNIVINCSAYNFVDKAESEPELAYKVNAESVGNLADICNHLGALFVHFSTDYVFDGKSKMPYKEDDITNPLNIYGKSKLAGENYIKEISENYLIFRVSWLYGRGKQNFIAKFLDWAKNSRLLQIAENEVSVPTYTGTVAWIVQKAIKSELRGLYHIVNDGSCSRFELAQFIAEIMNVKAELEPVDKDIFNLPAKRPNFSVLDNTKIKNELGIAIPDWKMDLRYFLFNMKFQEKSDINASQDY